MLKDSRGQTMIEVLVALSIAVVVIGALAIATIVSIRNASFAENQTKATKLAQEGIEKVKIIRDRDGPVTLSYGAPQPTQKFSDLWNIPLYNSCNPCYFQFPATNPLSLTGSPSVASQEVDGLSRVVLIEDEERNEAYPSEAYRYEKKVIVKVRWTDPSGTHESNLQTVLVKQL